MKVFFQNYTENNKVTVDSPLFASLEQALELYESMPQNDGSYMGIVNNRDKIVRFSKYNKFVWLVEIPVPQKQGAYQIFLTYNRCKNLIRELYKGFNPMAINGLTFERFTG